MLKETEGFPPRISVQPSRWLEKRPDKLKMKLMNVESVSGGSIIE
jgi:hypothetical protein